MAHLRGEPQGGEVLLISHAAHQRLPFVLNKAAWDLVYDEAPAAQWCEAVNLPDTHALLTDLIEIGDGIEFLRVLPKDRPRLQAIAKNRNADEFYGRLAPIANVLLSPHWDCYVDAEQFANVVDAHGSKRQLIFHATINSGLFQGYRSVTLLAADAHETALHQVLAGKVAFRETKVFDRHLRYDRHPNGDLLTVEFLSEEDWSKNHRDKKAEDGRTFLDHALEKIKARVGGRTFAWMGNKDLADDTFGKAPCVRLPNTSHGLNTYQHLHDAVLLSALNPPPAHFGFLASVGIDGDAVRTALYRQQLYQAACRISLRNPSDANAKLVVVPDKSTAEWLAQKFPGCGLAPLAGMPQLQKGKPGRPRLHESDAARKAKKRAEQKARRTAELAALRAAETCPENTFIEGINGHFGEAAEPPVWATLYTSLFDTEPSLHLRCATWDRFAACLRASWQDAISGKGETAKLIPSHMDPAYSAKRDRAATCNGVPLPAGAGWADGSGVVGAVAADCEGASRRGGDNVVSARMVALDNDGGDLSAAEFARLMRGTKMLVVNSYSSTPEAPRWRAYMPTDVPVTGEIYGLLTRRIMQRLKAAGYWSKEALAINPNIKSRLTHGFDMVKLGPASIFDLPSQAGAGPDASFDLYDEGREPLDVDLWLRSVQVQEGELRAEEHAAMMREFEERWKDVPEEQQRAVAAQIAWECWDELSDEDKAIIPRPDVPRPV